MARREFDLKGILDIPLWEKVQDQLAKLTGTAIITVDYKGTPVTKHSCRTEFCSVIRENPVSRKRCYRCDALAGLEAVRLERPYIYLCHCGIVDVAVPVMVGNRYLGAVMFGQVRIANNDNSGKVERLVNEISSFQNEGEAARKELIEKFNRLPEMAYGRIVEVADLINSIVSYVVDRAIQSRNEVQTYKWLMDVSSDAPGSAGAEITGLEELVPESAPEDDETHGDISKSSAVYPAVAYIKGHLSETVTMNSMAELCHLSPSYFSRLFGREAGENYNSYVNRQKINASKRLLRETNKTVSQIAFDLGYQDVSHYISLFKRFEGITPTVYRQYKYK